MVDVTAFKVVFQETLGVKYPKTGAHRALEDIRESIAELKFYLGKLKP